MKNYNRDEYSFANINLLGKCNVDCFFCLGKDLEEQFKPHNQLYTHYRNWKNFEMFLDICKQNKISKLYITGQNTDSLLYDYLDELINYLHVKEFKVGLRTNGYLALTKIDTINKCELSTGYSIHSINPITNRMIMGRISLPEWEKIIPITNNVRVSIVLNRCNESEFFSILRYISRFTNVKYVQVRRVSTDTREMMLAPDVASYERIYTEVSRAFPLIRKFFADAEEYNIYGIPTVFWRTVKTSVNSMNYFTDGTISRMYFVVEGYLKNYVDLINDEF